MTKKHVFLTGLPRMRSAWLSNLLTHGNNFCYHDVFSYVETMENFHQLMNRDYYDVVGVSDPSLVFFWEELSMAYPKATWIVIERPFDESLASCQKAFGEFEENNLHIMKAHLERLKYRLNPRVFDFNNLDYGSIHGIAKLCGISMNSDRIVMLMRFQVQIEPKYLLTKIQELKNYPTPLMKDLNASILA